MKLALLAAALLAGCTSMPAEQASNWDICAYTMGGGDNAMVAQREAQRRRLDCTAYYPAINAKRAQQDQAMTNYLRQINPPPQPMPFPQTTRCHTIYSGNVAHTTCD